MEYTTYELIEVLEQVKPIRMFFANFFPDRITHLEANKLEIQFKKGKVSMAPFVSPRVGGVIMSRLGHESYTVTPPRLSVDKIISMDDLEKKVLGETVYSTKTIEERALQLMADDYNESVYAIEGRIEWMAREIILNGNISITDVKKGVDINIDYNFTNRTVLLDGATWDNDDVNPLDDIEDWRVDTLTKSGVNPRNCILGRKAYRSFINNKNVKEKLNNRRIDVGMVKSRFINDALTLRAELEGMHFYTYDESFINDNNENEQMMPINKVILIPDKVGATHFGAVKQMNADKKPETFASQFVPKEVIDVDNEVIKRRVTSRPIQAPFDVDSWYVADVVED